MLEKSEALRVDGDSIGVHVNGWRVLEQLRIAAAVDSALGPELELEIQFPQVGAYDGAVVAAAHELFRKEVVARIPLTMMTVVLPAWA